MPSRKWEDLGCCCHVCHFFQIFKISKMIVMLGHKRRAERQVMPSRKWEGRLSILAVVVFFIVFFALKIYHDCHAFAWSFIFLEKEKSAKIFILVMLATRGKVRWWASQHCSVGYVFHSCHDHHCLERSFSL